MGFQKVNVGNQPNGVDKQGRFNLGCDSFFTSEFGVLVPSYVQEFIPKSKVSLNTRSLIRVAPLANVTAGRISLKHYHTYIPYKDVFEPFEALLANAPFNFDSSSSVPVLKKLPFWKILYYFLNDYAISQSTKEQAVLRFPVISPLNSGELMTKTEWNSSFSVNAQQIGEVIAKSGANEAIIVLADAVFKVVISNISTFACTTTQLQGYADLPQVTPENADSEHFVDTIALEVAYSPIQKHIRKLLTSLGYPYETNTVEVSLLPLLCYYKVWFSLFGINRYSNFESTSCSRLIRIYSTSNNVDWFSSTSRTNLLASFLQSVRDDCYYVFGPDAYTSQVIDMADNQASSSIVSTNNINGTTDTVQSDSAKGAKFGDATSGIQHVLAEKLLRFVNTNTIIGRKISNYIKAHYGFVKDSDEVYLKATCRIPVQIDDLFSTADTENATLGDYTGKAIGSGDGVHINYDVKEFGLWLTFSVVVPEPGYFQGCSKAVFRNSREDFYISDFDSAGYEGTSLLEFCSDNANESTRLIGLQPRYMNGYKFKNNQIVGDFRNKSTRNQFSGYFLDRYFERVGISRNNYNLSDTILRVLNPFNDIFNLNRIFQYTGHDYDHFYVFNRYDVDCYAPMIPIEDSFVNTEQDASKNFVERS